MRAPVVFAIGAVVLVTLGLSGCVPQAGDDVSTSTPTPSVSSTAGAPTPTGAPRPTSTATPRPTDDPDGGDDDGDDDGDGDGGGGGQSSVVPLITYSGFDPAGPVVEVVAFVPDIAQTDGQCSLTVTNGSQTAMGTGAARPDVASTQCGSLYATLPAGASGTWTAVVTYSSALSVGSSAPVSIKIG